VLAPFASPAQDSTLNHVLITNVLVWDGTGDTLTSTVNVLVEGNPLEDVSVFVNYEEDLKVVIKDGDVYKNTL